MDKNTLKNKVATAVVNNMKKGNPFAPAFKNAYIPIPNNERFEVREFVECNEKTAVVGYGKDDNEIGIYTQTHFIPLDELSYRELEKTLNVIHD